jgi:hypothetical protein
MDKARGNRTKAERTTTRKKTLRSTSVPSLGTLGKLALGATLLAGVKLLNSSNSNSLLTPIQPNTQEQNLQSPTTLTGTLTTTTMPIRQTTAWAKGNAFSPAATKKEDTPNLRGKLNQEILKSTNYKTLTKKQQKYLMERLSVLTPEQKREILAHLQNEPKSEPNRKLTEVPQSFKDQTISLTLNYRNATTDGIQTYSELFKTDDSDDSLKALYDLSQSKLTQDNSISKETKEIIARKIILKEILSEGFKTKWEKEENKINFLRNECNDRDVTIVKLQLMSLIEEDSEIEAASATNDRRQLENNSENNLQELSDIITNTLTAETNQGPAIKQAITDKNLDEIKNYKETFEDMNPVNKNDSEKSAEKDYFQKIMNALELGFIRHTNSNGDFTGSATVTKNGSPIKTATFVTFYSDFGTHYLEEQIITSYLKHEIENIAKDLQEAAYENLSTVCPDKGLSELAGCIQDNNAWDTIKDYAEDFVTEFPTKRWIIAELSSIDRELGRLNKYEATVSQLSKLNATIAARKAYIRLNGIPNTINHQTNINHIHLREHAYNQLKTKIQDTSSDPLNKQTIEDDVTNQLKESKKTGLDNLLTISLPANITDITPETWPSTVNFTKDAFVYGEQNIIYDKIVTDTKSAKNEGHVQTLTEYLTSNNIQQNIIDSYTALATKYAMSHLNTLKNNLVELIEPAYQNPIQEKLDTNLTEKYGNGFFTEEELNTEFETAKTEYLSSLKASFSDEKIKEALGGYTATELNLTDEATQLTAIETAKIEDLLKEADNRRIATLKTLAEHENFQNLLDTIRETKITKHQGMVDVMIENINTAFKTVNAEITKTDTGSYDDNTGGSYDDSVNPLSLVIHTHENVVKQIPSNIKDIIMNNNQNNNDSISIKKDFIPKESFEITTTLPDLDKTKTNFSSELDTLKSLLFNEVKTKGIAATNEYCYEAGKHSEKVAQVQVDVLATLKTEEAVCGCDETSMSVIQNTIITLFKITNATGITGQKGK